MPHLCDGEQDEHGNSCCDGPDVKRYNVQPSPDEPSFYAYYCRDCAWQAEYFGYVLDPQQETDSADSVRDMEGRTG